LITIPGFETNIKYAEEELKWYYAATNKIDFSPVIKKTWQKFSDDNMTVNSAYGIRIFGKHKIININQWDWCIEKLKNDIGSRQAIINLNSYFDKLTLTKDFVCTIYFQIFIRNNKLIWITNMRSQDIYYGTRNDIYCFTKMQQRMAKELNIECGEYIHICNSLHIYEQQYYKLKEVM
jgi:thymidylate synthase